MNSTPNIEKILKELPDTPGVYKFKNADGVIIYVGKAKNLRNRVRSYFQERADLEERKQIMVKQITDIEYIVVGTELEALMLETNLIKEFKPDYNIMMKDDKGFVYIRISTHEDFPRITTVRRKEKDKARYFGPKTAAYKVKETLELLRKILPFRHCDLDIQFKKENDVEVTHKVIQYPCLYYHIRKCSAPCIGLITPTDYQKTIEQVIEFLEGKPDQLLTHLKEQMMQAAKDQKFERAASIRDKMMHVEEIFEKQRINDPSRKDTDIFHYIVDNKKIFTNLFQVRDGRIIGQENFLFNTEEMSDKVTPHEIIEAFIRDYYDKATSIPKEILIPDQIEDQETLENWLSEKKGQKVKIIFPLIGEKSHLLELSLKNAASFAHQHKAKWMKEEGDQAALQNIQKIFNLKKLPKRMECYDISHVGGTSTVASMVVFRNGAPDPSEYRRFRLRTIPHGKPDDYASMREVLTRRLKYIRGTSYSFKLCTKKLFPEITSIIESEKGSIDNTNLEPKQFLCMLDKEKLIGFVRESENNEIRSLWIHPDYRGNKLGYELIYKLMEKNKAKKYYVYIVEKLKDYYEKFGFQEVKSIPENYNERIKDHGILLMVETGKLMAQYKKFAVKPDLLILDGGKGQLSIGVEVLKTLKLDIPICSLAKQEEEIFVPDKKDPIRLPFDSKTLHMFQRIRDEAHRFAITYSGKSHNKSLITSQLDEIQGIGEISKQKLLNTFGTLENIKFAPLDQLARVIGKKAAIKVKQELQKN